MARLDAREGQLPEYGHVIVDEFHHVAAPTYESVISRLPTRYLLGLTAMPRRRDGHHPIMRMLLGPIRFEVSAKQMAKQRPFAHRYFVRPTELCMAEADSSLADLQGQISRDAHRSSFILDDTVAALRDGRSPLILCQRREHALALAERLERYAPNLLVLLGGMGVKQQREAFARLQSMKDADQRLIISTGKFVGEGFDDPRLDTLILAAPVSWKGT